MNKIEILGRTTKDVELKGTKENQVATFTLAVDRKGAKEKTTDFIDCVAYGKLVEIFKKYVTKGTKIIVCGSLLQGHWTDKDGKNQSKLYVRVDDFYFTESAPKKEQNVSQETNKLPY